MPRCASSLVIAAYGKVRLIPQDSRALPAAFLRSRPIFKTFKTFYEVVNSHVHRNACGTKTCPREHTGRIATIKPKRLSRQNWSFLKIAGQPDNTLLRSLLLTGNLQSQTNQITEDLLHRFTVPVKAGLYSGKRGLYFLPFDSSQFKQSISES
jgi:hypothetical protein